MVRTGLVGKGFSRIPYLLSFLFKLALVALFFAINGTIAAAARLSEGASFYQNETILVQTQNSGLCSYSQVSLGAINLSVETNEHPGDVIIQVTVSNIHYDDSYDKEVIGEEMGEFEDLVPSKEGPWDLFFQYAIESKSAHSIPDESRYYEVGFAGKNYPSEVVSNGSTNRLQTDLIAVNKSDSLTLTINLGSPSRNSALPKGEYRLHIALFRGEVTFEKIGLSRTVKLAFLTYRHALFHLESSDLFNFQNILSIIVLLYSIGTAVYFYPDLRSAKRFYDERMSEVYCGPIGVTKKTFQDPYSGSTYTTTETAYSGPSVVLCLLETALYFVMLVALVPIRFFVYLIKDLVFAITGKKPFSMLYGLGCFIGSLGLWLILESLALFLAANWVLGAVFAVVGVGALVGAHFLANDDHLVAEDD